MIIPKLVVKKNYKVSREVLFKAWTSAESMSQWLNPMPGGQTKVSADFKVGGSYKIDMVAPDGEVFPHWGKYREISPYDKIVFTWNSPFVKDTRVTGEFNKLYVGCELVLTHEFLKDEKVFKEHNDGWEAIFDYLETNLSKEVV
ncbi:MAG: SRPBCC domain-containing protein [Spirochaetes bacterium]|nr:SRPBCC domain-containing protein [Spirochaetota bacterium]